MSIRYVVKSGDTLGGIASRHGLKSYREIYDHPENAEFRVKRPNPDKIYPGDVLMIPEAKKDSDVSLPPPWPVGQANSYWCWAASLEAWLNVSDREQRDQFELMEDFKAWTDPRNGGLTAVGWGQVSIKYRMLGRVYSRRPGFNHPSTLTAEWLQTTLKEAQGKYILLIYNISPDGPSHVVVVYGVQVKNGTAWVKAMDPMGKGELVSHPLRFYTHRDALTVMWSRD
jgi:hypothetical protein